MKTLAKFADRQLSKQEMNHVKGGYDCWDCTIYFNGHLQTGKGCGESIEAVEAALEEDYIELFPSFKVICV